jgi:hypothetical protein
MFREHYMKVISDKHDDVMAKFGAILAHGILDAGLRTEAFPLTSLDMPSFFRWSQCNNLVTDS